MCFGEVEDKLVSFPWNLHLATTQLMTREVTQDVKNKLMSRKCIEDSYTLNASQFNE